MKKPSTRILTALLSGLLTAGFFSSQVSADTVGQIDRFPVTGAFRVTTVQDLDHVTVMDFLGGYDKDLPDGGFNVEPRTAVAKEFFRLHPDTYDFLVVFTTFEFSTPGARAFYHGVRNEVRGIGLPLFDNASRYGSQGRLQGMVDMAALSRWETDPVRPLFEDTLSVIAHEIMHRWGAHVRFRDESGQVSKALLGQLDSHWSFGLDSGASVLYGNSWRDNGDGTFTSGGSRNLYSPLDLYLMGFYDKSEVPPIKLIENPEIDAARLPEPGVTVAGTSRQIAIDQIIAAEGERLPPAKDAQKSFTAAFVLLTPQGIPPTPSQLAAVKNIQRAWTSRFSILTGGRGVLEVYSAKAPPRPEPPAPPGSGDPRTSPPSLDEGLAWLLSRQNPEGSWEDARSTAPRDTESVIETLSEMVPGHLQYAKGVEWLASAPAANTDTLVRRMTAALRANGDVSPLAAQLVSVQGADGGWGLAAGLASSPVDTALAVQVLRAAGIAGDGGGGRGLAYLLAQQNTDGSWSAAPGGEGRVGVTVEVLKAVGGFKGASGVDTARGKALAWLKGRQNPDGGFGDSPSTVYDTSSVLSVLLDSDFPAAQVFQAANYLWSAQGADGSWRGSAYQTAKAIGILRKASAPNLSIREGDILLSSPAPVDGEKVSVAVRLRNEGRVAVENAAVRLYDGDPGAGGQPVGPDQVLPRVEGLAVTEVRFLWDTIGRAGNRTLVAVVDPDGKIAEYNEQDNRTFLSVDVRPAPDQADILINAGEISVFPERIDRLPSDLSVTALVRNTGRTPVSGAVVALYDGDPGAGGLKLGETVINVSAQSSAVANFSTTLRRGGEIVYTLVADPSNAIPEFSEDNNVAVKRFATGATVDLSVAGEDLTVSADPVSVGQDLTISVNIRNSGTLPAYSVPVRVTVTGAAGAAEIGNRTVSVEAGSSKTNQLVWRVDQAGVLKIGVRVDPDNQTAELDETNNAAERLVTALGSTSPNLKVSHREITTSPDPAREWGALAITAIVRNNGFSTVDSASVAFHDGDPASGGVQIGEAQAVANLPAGGSQAVSVAWPRVPDSKSRLIFVVVDSGNAVAEFDEEDNKAFKSLEILSVPDLAVTPRQIALAPAFPREGEAVSVRVEVANLGDQSAPNVLVRLFDGAPRSGGVPIGGDQVLSVVPGHGQATAVFAWSPARAGTRTLFAQVDPLGAVEEREKGNNLASKVVALQNANLWASNPYFSPNGDGVKDDTAIFFRLPSAATLTVAISDKKGRVVRRIVGDGLANVTEGSVSWNGLDDSGRLVPDGKYGASLVSAEGVVLGEIVVVVDTNRSSLGEALGTQYALYSNLSCLQPDIEDFQWRSDESRIYFRVPWTNVKAPEYPRGVYSMAPDGEDVRPLISTGEFSSLRPVEMRVAPGGSRVLVKAGYPYAYWLMDGEGRGKEVLDLAPVAEARSFAFSRDGRYLFFAGQTLGPDGNLRDGLYWMDLAGDRRAKALFDGSGDYVVSPAGDRVALRTGWETTEFWILTLAGNRVRVGAGNSWDAMAWSPDGRRLAVTGRGITIVDASGENPKTYGDPGPVPPGTTVTFKDLAWSPSGDEVALARYVTEPLSGWLYRRSGGIFLLNLAAGEIAQAQALATFEGGGEGPLSYHVDTWDGSRWAERGVLHYGLQYSEKELDLSRYLPDSGGEYKVRIRQKGLEAAHVDAVSLKVDAGRIPPVFASVAGGGADVLKKIKGADHDVVDLHEKEMLVRWENVPASPRVSLVLLAREEGDLTRLRVRPFAYPDPATGTDAYEVKLVESGPVKVDGAITPEDGLGAPLFSVRSVPVTGHPAGYVDGYVKTDGEHLFAVLDFTPDNTLDGEKDWARLSVLTPKGWKDYTLTEAGNRYGKAGFTYTKRVSYQHKVYEFRVPLAERGAGPGDVLRLKFAAYGTAAGSVSATPGLPQDGTLRWIPGDRGLLYAHYGQSWAIDLEGSGSLREVPGVEKGWGDKDVSFSPLGRHLVYWSALAAGDPTSSCYGRGWSDAWSLQSLLNLTADLRAVKGKSGGILLKGIAADLNFESYDLEYARVESPAAWSPVTPASTLPVVNDVFALWVPPSDGVYLVRLTVRDKAGNARSDTRRVSWGMVPAITNLYREPQYISPNGDGTNEAATIHYVNLEPVHLTFEFFDAGGNRVRTISRDHAAVGEEHALVWDGRDDVGRVVPDGVYRMTVLDYELSITVDGTSPAASVHLSGAYQMDSEDSGGTRKDWSAVRPSLLATARDPNFAAYTLESGTGAIPGDWKEPLWSCPPAPDSLGGISCKRDLSLGEYVNRNFRLRVADRAGNEAAATSGLGPEELIVYGYDRHDKDKTISSRVPFVSLGKTPGTGAAIDLDLGLAYRLSLAETVRRPIQWLVMQYRKETAGGVTTWDPAWQERLMSAPSGDGFFQADWDVSVFEPGAYYLVSFKAIDDAGGEVFSNPAVVHSEALVLRKFRSESDRHVFSGFESITEDLTLVRFFIRSKDDLRYGEWTAVGTPSPGFPNAFPRGDLEFEVSKGEIEACKTYELKLRGSGVSGRVYESVVSGYSVPCLKLDIEAEPVKALACNEPSPEKVRIKFKPVSLDGKLLKIVELYATVGGASKLIHTVANPASGAVYEYVLDVSSFPEGTSRVAATLRNIDDKEGAGYALFIVDRTPPVARLVYPLDGQKLCAVPMEVTVSTPSGSRRTLKNLLPVEGEVSDDAGWRYEIQVATPADPENWRSVKSPFPEGSPPMPSDEKGFRTGSYSGRLGLLEDHGDLLMRLVVSDKGGAKMCSDPVAFYLDGRVEVLDAKAVPGLFSPTGDGVLDQSEFSYQVDEAVTSEITVHRRSVDALGREAVETAPLFSLMGPHANLGGTEVAAWDGFLAGGSRAPDGLYAVKVTAKDACGNVAEKWARTAVDATAPSAQILYPKASDPLGTLVEVRGNVSDENLQGYRLEVGQGEFPETWLSLGVSEKPAADAVLGRWNTYGLEGPYTLRITAGDKAGNTRELTQTVTVLAKSPIVNRLEVVPPLFSPNGDGQIDTARISFGLTQVARTTIAVYDANDLFVRNLETGASRSVGDHNVVWDGTNDGGAVVPDGTYRVRLKAALLANPDVQQEEKATVTVDGTPPRAELARPAANGFIKAVGGIVGTIEDPHLLDYSVEFSSAKAPAWTLLESGKQNRTNAVFRSLEDLADGTYSVRIRARDEAGNAREALFPFTVDGTPPKASLTAPAAGSFVGGKKKIVSIAGTIEEANLAEFVVRHGPGESPASWTDLARSGVVPAGGVRLDWDVSSVPDGVYTISLTATDKAGSAAETRVSVTVDKTPPEVSVTSPSTAGYVKSSTDVIGTIGDSNLQSYTVAVAKGDPSVAYQWTPIGSGTAGVSAGRLARWESLPPDGVYTVRVQAADRAENAAEAKIAVTVDTHPPGPPAGLTAAKEGRQDVRLAWNANAEPDLAGYNVYRNGGKISSSLVTQTAYLDASAPEGSHAYSVRAVDIAGWESGPSNEVRVTVDVTPPAARISAPGAGTVVSGQVDVKGTAYSEADFKEYRLFVGAGANPEAWTLLRRSPVPSPYDVLASWPTFLLPEGSTHTLKLEAEDLAGNVAMDRATVTVDNLPPAAPTGLSGTVTGGSVGLAWNANAEPDIAGYLLYRNGRLANVPGLVVGNLKPYLIAATAYPDNGLPDGRYTYSLVAMDQAGNLSEPSASVVVTVDTRPPHAIITYPANLSRIGGPVSARAESADLDVAQVLFQYRAEGAPGWTDIGVDAEAPFGVNWNPAGLAYGNYEIRAVAADLGGKVDPAPTPITVLYTDTTPPAVPAGFAARVNGDAAALSWSANAEADLAGYNLYRTAVGGIRAKVNASAIAGIGYVDSGLSDGLYVYVLRAVDASGNESLDTDEAKARVYAPSLDQPYTPRTDPNVVLAGRDAEPGGAIEALIDAGGGFAPRGAGAADGQGAFRLDPIALASGASRIAARVTDGAGNVSKPSPAVTVVVDQAPAPPTGLAAVAEAYNVRLSWDLHPEADVIGYRIFRNGQPVAPSANVAPSGVAAASTVSSWEWPLPEAGRTIDGVPETYWMAQPQEAFQPEWLEVALPTPQVIAGVDIDWAKSPPWEAPSRTLGGKDYEIQAWSGAAWIPVARVAGNASETSAHALASTYRTDRIRIFVTAPMDERPYASLGIREVRIWDVPLVSEASSVDLSLRDGRYRYAVTAVDRYAFESAPSSEASVDVGDVAPPNAPLGLAAAVEGSDVRLSWTPSPEPDAAGYAVYRDGAKVGFVSNSSGSTYLDAGRPNGLYRYRVTAIDQAGNESPPSNEATAAVSMAVPSAPLSLTAASVPEGGALDLSWRSGGSPEPVGYHVYRSQASGGPHERITGTPAVGFSHRDRGLANGARYFYVVRAVDAAGNESGASNEASGVPGDLVAPDKPILYFPTIAGRPVVLRQSWTSVAGAAEPGAAVTLLREGTVLGRALSLSETAREKDGIARSWGQGTSLSPAGDRLAYSAGQLIVRDRRTGEERELAPDGRGPVWSPAGDRVAFASGWNGQFGVANVETGESSFVAEGSDPSWSPDGSQIVFSSARSGSAEIWAYVLGTGETRQMTASGLGARHPRFSPDGKRLAYVTTGGGTTLWVLDLGTGAQTRVADGARESPAAWSPDGRALAFASAAGGNLDVWVWPADGGGSVRLTDAPEDEWGPEWSPDGGRVAYRTERSVRVKSVGSPGGLVLTDARSELADVQWTRSGRIAYEASGFVEIVRLPGWFEIPVVEPRPVENRLAGVAADAAGNASSPSDEIVLLYDLSGHPDLVVQESDIFIYPAFPVSGDRVGVSAVVRNRGEGEARDVEVEFLTVSSAGAVEVVAPEAIERLGPGESRSVSIEWDTAGKSGLYTVLVLVDSADRIPEVSERNNYAYRDVNVAKEAGVSVDVATDKPEYESEQSASIAAVVTNTGTSKSLILDVRVEDANGYLVQALPATDSFPLGYGETRRFDWTWSTGTLFAGEYRVRAVVRSGAAVEREASASFRILPRLVVEARIAPDRASFGSNEAVTLTSSVSNASPNVPIEGAEAVVTVADPAGEIRHREVVPIASLLPGRRAEFVTRWNSGTSAPGTYRAALNVLQAGAGLAVASADVVLAADGGAKPVVTGSLDATPVVAPLGETVRASFRLANGGNAAFIGLPVRLWLTDPRTLAALRTFETSVDLPVGGTASGDHPFPTDGLNLGSYVLLLQVWQGGPTAGAFRTLASATITTVDRRAPQIRAVTPADGGFHNGPVRFEAEARDDLSLVASVEYRLDEGPWTPLPPGDMASGRYATTWTPGPADERGHALSFRAADTAGNDAGTSSADANPVSVRFTIDLTPPVVAIAGVEDGGLYAHPVTPAVSGSDANLLGVTVILNGRLFAGGTAIAADGRYVLEATAADKAGNRTTKSAAFEIDMTQPDPPVVAEPKDGIVLQAEKVDVAGTAEPGSTVTIEQGDWKRSVLADGAGAFVFQAVPLAYGPNAFMLTATDRAGNVSRPAALTLHRIALKIEKRLIPAAHVLIGLECDGKAHEEGDGHGHHEAGEEEGASPLKAWLERSLGGSGIAYAVACGEEAFIRAMRSGGFNLYLIADVHSSGHQGKFLLESDMVGEVREAVAGGEGLLVIKTHPDEWPKLREVLGVNTKGNINGVSRIEIEGTEVTQPATLAYAGQAVSVEAETARVLGNLFGRPDEENHHEERNEHDKRETAAPAATLNAYGFGKAAFLAFDPSGVQNEPAAQTLLTVLLLAVAPVDAYAGSGRAADVEIAATTMGAPMDVKIVESVPAPLAIFDAGGGDVNGEVLTWRRSLGASETARFGYRVRLPDTAGTWTLKTSGYDLSGGADRLAAEAELAVAVDRDAAQQADDLLDALESLAVTGKDIDDLEKAKKDIREVVGRPATGRKDAERNIRDIIEAADHLLKIRSADARGPRLLLDRLLRTWEIKWWFLPEGS